MIHCRNVSKGYRGHPVLHAIDLTIKEGICGVLGANGAGKSTLLKLMSGLLVPDSGSITLAGLDLAEKPAAAKQILGVVPEELGLFESLTVVENLQMTGPIYGLSKEETRSSYCIGSALSMVAIVLPASAPMGCVRRQR